MSKNESDYRRFSNRNTTYNKKGEERRQDLLKHISLHLDENIFNKYKFGEEFEQYYKIFDNTNKIIERISENQFFLNSIKKKFNYNNLEEIKSDLLIPIQTQAKALAEEELIGFAADGSAITRPEELNNEEAIAFINTGKGLQFNCIDIYKYSNLTTDCLLDNKQLLRDLDTAVQNNDHTITLEIKSILKNKLLSANISVESVDKIIKDIDSNITKLQSVAARSALNLLDIEALETLPVSSPRSSSPNQSLIQNSRTISPELRNNDDRADSTIEVTAESINSRSEMINKARALGIQANGSITNIRSQKAIEQNNNKRADKINKSRGL